MFGLGCNDYNVEFAYDFDGYDGKVLIYTISELPDIMR